jgi:hypothetical protein
MNKDSINQMINAHSEGICRYDMHVYFSMKEGTPPYCIICGQKFKKTPRRRKKVAHG